MGKNLSRTDLLIYSIKKIFFAYFLLLFLMSGFRLFFTYYFGEAISSELHFDLAYAFMIGALYDTMVISYILIPIFFILAFISLLKVKRLYNFFLFILHKWYFFISLILILLLISDMGFYSYFQDHLNILFFGLFEDDTMALFSTINKNYPVSIALISFFLFSLLWYFLTRFIFKSLKNKNGYTHGNVFSFSFLFFLMLILFFGASRGSFSSLPLSPKYTSVSSNAFINQVSQNGIITFQKAYRLRNEFSRGDNNVGKSMGLDTPHEAFSAYLGFDTTPTNEEDLVSLLKRKTKKDLLLEEVKPHVILFVMESFGSFWLKFHDSNLNLLGALEEHIKEDYFFKRILSSDNGTIGSLTSLLSNIPYLPNMRFLNESKYLNLPLKSSSLVPYLRRGYETTFIYGGKLLWRDIGKYAKVQGFHHVVGEEGIRQDLGLSKTEGTEWGIYDEYIYKYIKKKLLNSTRPEFIVVMTTTNHPPYEIPKDYRALPIKIEGELKERITREEDLMQMRLLSYQYANNKLGEFIKGVKEDSNLQNKTIISFTGDHNFWGFINYKERELYEKYSVPFYIYLPKKLRIDSYDPMKLGSHNDIMTTLYNVSLSSTSYTSFGQNLMNEGETFSIGADVKASKHGASYRDNFYPFLNDTSLVDESPTAGDPELEIYYKSLISTAYYFLELSYKKSNTSKNF